MLKWLKNAKNLFQLTRRTVYEFAYKNVQAAYVDNWIDLNRSLSEDRKMHSWKEVSCEDTYEICCKLKSRLGCESLVVDCRGVRYWATEGFLKFGNNRKIWKEL